MKALALGVLVSFAAFAADPTPTDAPLAEPAPISETQIINLGDTATVTGPALVLPASSAIHLAQRISMAEAERDALRKEVATQSPSWVVPLVAVCAFVAGGALGVSVGIAYANTHPK